MHSRFLRLLTTLSLSTLAVATAQTPGVPAFTVGRNLQVSGEIGFKTPLPEGGAAITITSAEPDKVVFSTHIAQNGTPSIVLEGRAGMRESPEFWVHGLADDGVVEYTVSSQAFGELRGTVTLTPSAVLLIGPFRAPVFKTTPRSAPVRLTLATMRLDAAQKAAEPQALAGGMKLELELETSDSAVGRLEPSTVTLDGGTALATAEFSPTGTGSTEISVSAPPGFSKPLEHGTVTVSVNQPGIALTQDLTIGENLQVIGMVGLGEPAPPGGVTVTLTSSDPAKLLLSPSPTEAGSAKVRITIPAGKVSGEICIQSLTKSGSASYTATAEGHQSRTEKVSFAPSGVVVMLRPYGPPDEAELLRPHAGSVTGGVWASLSKGDKLPLSLWMVQLDPVTLRGADITVQPLRGGAKLEVDLQVSDPAIGKIHSPVLIASGHERAATEFTPTAVGSTVISVVTPAGFTKVANSTSITATVTQ